MLTHFLKISFRRLFIDKTFSFVNLIGLIIGISSVFLLSKYLGFHITIDDFQERKENIFAIHQTLTNSAGESDYTESTYNAVAPLAKDLFPEITQMSRYLTTGETLIRAENQNGDIVKFNEQRIVEVDPDFIQIFTFDFLQGDPEIALNEPNSIVISASMARKYFGDGDPIGQTLSSVKRWGKTEDWTVSGVFTDYPKNSNFEFDFLQSLAGKKLDDTEQGGWAYADFKSYLLLDESSKANSLAEKITSMIMGVDVFKAKEEKVSIQLVALEEVTPLTSGQQLLIWVGLVLLLITWINYTNLSGAKSLTRGKEFGVRRVLGSDKAQLVSQFLYEAVLIYLIATVGIVLVIVSVYPLLFTLADGQMLPIWELGTPINLVFLGFLFSGAVVSALYPSFSVSGLSITRLLTNKKAGNPRSQGFRQFLVVFQFTVSIIMLIGVTAIYMQVEFMKNQDVGFDTDQILILKSPKDKWHKKWLRMANFKNELRSRPFAKAVTTSNTVPLWWPGSPTDFDIEAKNRPVRMVLIGVDEEYFNCYDINLVAGESFRKGQSEANRKWAIVNETATRKMGYLTPEEALNQKVRNLKEDKELEIIGVVKDHHHESLRKEIKPQLFEFRPIIGFVSIKLDHNQQTSIGQISGVIENTREIWHEIYPDQAFDYYFLDDRFNDIYERERVFQKIFLTFTLISVLVTFLGIFGLSMFMAIRRKKEIGIRKVLGARPGQILALFFNEFMKKAGLAILVGTPIAYYFVKMWLENYSYRIEVNAWMLVIPCLILVVLTMISLSFESVKMARVDPVDILKEE